MRGVLHDQKPIWLFPVHAVEGRHWRSVVPTISGIAALIELDPNDAPYFRRTTRFVGLDRVFSSTHTAIAEGLFPAAWYLTGVLAGRSGTARNALATGEALVDAELVAEVMKNIDRRLLPGQIPPDGDFVHTWFKLRRRRARLRHRPFHRGPFPLTCARARAFTGTRTASSCLGG